MHGLYTQQMELKLASLDKQHNTRKIGTKAPIKRSDVLETNSILATILQFIAGGNEVTFM